jgi:hypothetical protein
MVLSLAVVMAGVLIFVIFVMPRGDREADVKVVETTAPLAAFARQAPYEVVTPAGLPLTWKATSVRTRLPSSGTSPSGSTGSSGGTSDDNLAEVTIGYVIDEPDQRRFASFVSSNAPDAVQRVLGDRPVTGEQVVDGMAWQRRSDGDGHLALTRTSGEVTVIVEDGGGEGGAVEDDLVRLAASLRPA